MATIHNNDIKQKAEQGNKTKKKSYNKLSILVFARGDVVSLFRFENFNSTIETGL